MASGSYTRKKTQQLPLEEGVTKQIPARATRQEKVAQESMQDDYYNEPETTSVAPLGRSLPNKTRSKANPKKPLSPRPQATAATSRRPSDHRIKPRSYRGMLGGHRLKPWVLCLIGAICFLTILLSVGIFRRVNSNLIYTGGQSYDIQVGGNQAGSWQQDHPMDPQKPIVPQTGPYVVLSNPSISADFINKVLSNYHSPTAGKGQALYDLGAQYNIDPAFALAFFLHESSFGTMGEAAKSLSLGNLRCIPNYRCEDNFAQFNTWEDGFKAWYQLIRNLYVAQWGLTTVDQIIPRYAPSSDNNNEQGYIAALKHAIDTWHASQITVN